MKNDCVTHLRHFFCRGICVVLCIGFQQAVLGTTLRHARYHTVVTNILDDKRIAIEGRRLPNGIILNVDIPVVLNGIEIPQRDSLAAKTFQNVLEKILVGKRVNVVELLETDRSRGGSIYVTDDFKRFSKEDNINLMLIRDGIAKWSGKCNVSDISPEEMEEAQRQAQKAHRGIWGSLPENALTPLSSQIVTNVAKVTSALQEVVAVPDKTDVSSASSSAPSSQQPNYVVPVSVGAGLLAAFAILFAHLWRHR